MAVFSGPLGHYTVQWDDANDWLIVKSDTEGVDHAIRIETLTFAGIEYAASDFEPMNTLTRIDVGLRAQRSLQPISDVDISMGNQTLSTDASGMAQFTSVIAPSAPLSTTVNSTSAAHSNATKAVTIQDAVSILKMIAGLPVNADGTPVSRFQSLAADFDASGAVSLADAIAVLRHSVGLQAPAPSWIFVKDSHNALPSVLNPGTADPVTVDLIPPSPVEVNLIGILRGDVDASWDPHRYGVSGGV